MKNLIVYYSYEGNTEALVKAMTEVVDADVLRLEPEKEKKTKSLFRFVWGGMQVYMNKQPKLKPYTVNLSQYDKVVLGGPCWFGTYAPPINSFLKENDLTGKQVYLLMCDGNNLRTTWEDYKKALPEGSIAGKIDFVYPVKNGIEDASAKVKAWAEENLK